MRRTNFSLVLSIVVTNAAALSLIGCSTERPKPAAATATSAPAPPPVTKDRSPAAAPSASSSASPAKRDAASSPGKPRVEPGRAERPVVETTALAAPTTGTLEFETDVPGVQVFIDRNPVGVTPLTVRDVTPGSHRLNLSAPGYEPVSESIDVEAGTRRLVYTFKDVRLNLKTEVVHKHRFGQCKGTLTATQHGVRYDTTDRDDAFSVGVLDIDTLEIDYLQNRLRIGIHGGKRYDFSDPDGNADHLFVFHRDLTKARERLKKGDPPGP